MFHVVKFKKLFLFALLTLWAIPVVASAQVSTGWVFTNDCGTIFQPRILNIVCLQLEDHAPSGRLKGVAYMFNGTIWAVWNSSGSGGSQHKVNGTDVLTNDPINYLDTTSILFANPSAGSITATPNLQSGSGIQTSSGFSLLRSCSDGQLLKWTAGTSAWGCANDTSAGSPTWDTLGNPAGNQALAMLARLTTWTWGNATGSGVNMFTLTDTASNSGTGYLMSLGTATGSAAKPFRLTAQGTANGVEMTTAGALTPIGTGSIITDFSSLTGTIAGASFPATLPALSGVNLTALNASNLASGEVPSARLTNLDATNLTLGTIPGARLPATLPALSGVNLTGLNASNLASGEVPSARLTNLDASNLTTGTIAGARNTSSLLDGSHNLCPDSGSTDDYVCPRSVPVTTCNVNGSWLDLKVNTVNTGPATVNPDGCGVTTIVQHDGTALTNGLLAAGGTYRIQLHSSGNYRMQAGGTGAGTVTGTTGKQAVFTSASAVGNGLCSESGTTISCGDVSGNTHDEAREAATAVHTHTWKARSGDVSETTGALVTGNLAKFDSSGRVIDAGYPATTLTKSVQMMVVDAADDVATGDGKFYFRIPSILNGMNLTGVSANVITAGTTGTTDIQIARCLAATTGNACSSTVVDVLSTKLTIDSGENDSTTAAAAAVINASNDDMATGRLLRIDVDAVSTTAPKGLIVNLDFALP